MTKLTGSSVIYLQRSGTFFAVLFHQRFTRVLIHKKQRRLPKQCPHEPARKYFCNHGLLARLYNYSFKQAVLSLAAAGGRHPLSKNPSPGMPPSSSVRFHARQSLSFPARKFQNR